MIILNFFENHFFFLHFLDRKVVLERPRAKKRTTNHFKNGLIDGLSLSEKKSVKTLIFFLIFWFL